MLHAPDLVFEYFHNRPLGQWTRKFSFRPSPVHRPKSEVVELSIWDFAIEQTKLVIELMKLLLEQGEHNRTSLWIARPSEPVPSDGGLENCFENYISNSHDVHMILQMVVLRLLNGFLKRPLKAAF